MRFLSTVWTILFIFSLAHSAEAQSITEIEIGESVLLDLSQTNTTAVYQVNLETETNLQIDITYLGRAFAFQLEAFAEDGSLLTTLSFDANTPFGTIPTAMGNITLLFTSPTGETGRATVTVNEGVAPPPTETTPASENPSEGQAVDLAEWLSFDNTSQPSLNADGSLCLTDDTIGVTAYFEPSFDFVQSLGLGDTLRFDLRIDMIDRPYDDLDVQLVIGNGVLLGYDLPTPPTLATTTYEISLTSDAGWYDVDGVLDASDPAIFAEMMNSINTLRIRAEYNNGNDTTCISNVQILPADVTVSATSNTTEGEAQPNEPAAPQGNAENVQAQPAGENQQAQQNTPAEPQGNAENAQSQPSGEQGEAEQPPEAPFEGGDFDQANESGTLGDPLEAPENATDSDGDGIPDETDACPNEVGTDYGGGCNVDGGDFDGDGITNDVDVCPYVIGVDVANGCPGSIEGADTDQDGVLNVDDVCPNSQGDANPLQPALNGCNPTGDEDGDGILNGEDACPLIVGDVNNAKTALNGCPTDGDFDGDGVLDVDDTCPFTVGIDAAEGCLPGFQGDADGDGVTDPEDACPQEAGRYVPFDADQNGCPLAEASGGEANQGAGSVAPLALDGNSVQEGDWQIVNTAAGVGCEDSEILGPPVNSEPVAFNLRFAPEGIYWGSPGNEALFERTGDDPIFRSTATSNGNTFSYTLVFDSPTNGEYVFRTGPQGCDGVFYYDVSKAQ